MNEPKLKTAKEWLEIWPHSLKGVSEQSIMAIQQNAIAFAAHQALTQASDLTNLDDNFSAHYHSAALIIRNRIINMRDTP